MRSHVPSPKLAVGYAVQTLRPSPRNPGQITLPRSIPMHAPTPPLQSPKIALTLLVFLTVQLVVSRAIVLGQDKTTSTESALGQKLSSIPEGPFSLTQLTLTQLVERHCGECHSRPNPEANVLVNDLRKNLGQQSHLRRIERLLRAVQTEAMPPPDASLLEPAERQQLIDALDSLLNESAENARKLEPRPNNRRLTRDEYNFSLQQLLGVNAEFSDQLPEDPLSSEGYRNAVGRLGMSSLQLEAYLASARRAVERYIRTSPLPQTELYYFIEFEDLFYSTADRYAGLENAPPPITLEEFKRRRAKNAGNRPEYTDGLGPRLPGASSEDEMLRAAIPKLHQQYVAIAERLPVGELIIRVRAAGTADRNHRFPRMRVEAGVTLGDGCAIDKRVLGETDVRASVESPDTYEFRIRLEDVPSKGDLDNKHWTDPLSIFDLDQIFISNISPDEHAIFDKGRGAYATPQKGAKAIATQLSQMRESGTNFLHLDCVEIEMLPGVGSENTDYPWTISSGQTESEELKQVQQVLTDFMPRAFRRPVSSREIESKLELFTTLRTGDYTFEESLRETLAAVLISPAFLYVAPRWPDDLELSNSQKQSYRLASKLSYLLWQEPPDERLRELAASGRLLDTVVLHRQAERLLDDARNRRFLEDFCYQWLRLDKYRNVAVNSTKYPQFDEEMSNSFLLETLGYFVEVFSSRANSLDLLASDYVIVDDLLADHYGLSQLTSGAMQRVDLPEGSFRGGLLTQASILKMNSDGLDSHPIRRGVWLLERLLAMPPPPPPPNVPELDTSAPNLLGLTLKEKIEQHRQPGSCRNCHAKIDPWGIAFENFDAVGRWRTSIETEDANASPAPIDATTILPDETRIEDIRQLKQHLRERYREHFAESVVEHLLTYSLGRSPDYVERFDVERLRKEFVESDFQLRSLVLNVVCSELFQSEALSLGRP